MFGLFFSNSRPQWNFFEWCYITSWPCFSSAASTATAGCSCLIPTNCIKHRQGKLKSFFMFGLDDGVWFSIGMLLHYTSACLHLKKNVSLAAAFWQSDSLLSEVMWFLEKRRYFTVCLFVFFAFFSILGSQKARIIFQHGFQLVFSLGSQV